ncbi:MAG: lactate utilization protein [Candidatus Gracilibacteria bacterium]|jgi:L-lactate utilization protein LutB
MSKIAPFSKKLLTNLKANGFEVRVAKNKAAALKVAQKIVEGAGSVGIGGSNSVREIGLYDFLCEWGKRGGRGERFINPYEEGISREENESRRKAGGQAEVFVASSNAVSEDGFLINVDGSGNRVAAQIYGPERVLLIVGKNKIVKNVEEGFKRIEKIAAPKNVERINARAKTFSKPAAYTLKTIQNAFCVIKRCAVPGRIVIVLVEEELGF